MGDDFNQSLTGTSAAQHVKQGGRWIQRGFAGVLWPFRAVGNLFASHWVTLLYLLLGVLVVGGLGTWISLYDYWGGQGPAESAKLSGYTYVVAVLASVFCDSIISMLNRQRMPQAIMGLVASFVLTILVLLLAFKPGPVLRPLTVYESVFGATGTCYVIWLVANLGDDRFALAATNAKNSINEDKLKRLVEKSGR